MFPFLPFQPSEVYLSVFPYLRVFLRLSEQEFKITSDRSLLLSQILAFFAHTLVEKKYEISEHCNMANSIQNQLELQGEIVPRILVIILQNKIGGAKLMPNFVLCPQA